MNQDDTLRLTPDQELFAFHPYIWEAQTMPDSPVLAEEAFFKLRDPNADMCEQCGSSRLTALAYGEPAWKVVAHFTCKHSGIWYPHTAGPDTARL